MYFSFFKLKKWGKKTAAARRHNCAVLPYKFLRTAKPPMKGENGRKAPGGVPAVRRMP